MGTVEKYPCLCCMIKPVSLLARVLFVASITGTCSDEKKGSTFSWSRLWGFICFIATILFVYCGYLTIHSLTVTIENRRDHIHIVLLAIECIHQVSSVTLIICKQLLSGQTTRALNSISDYLANPGAGIKRAISKDQERKLIQIGVHRVIFICCVLTIQFGYIYYVFENEKEHNVSILSILKGLAITLNSGVILIMSLEFTIITKLLKYLFEGVHFRLKVLLYAAIERPAAEAVTDHPQVNKNSWMIAIKLISDKAGASLKQSLNYEFDDNDNDPICHKLGYVRSSYGYIHKCLRQVNNAMNPLILISAVAIITTIVLNSYLIVQFIILKNIRLIFVLTLFRLLLNTVCLVYMLVLAEELYRMVISNHAIQ